jgi:hypothetical protein
MQSPFLELQVAQKELQFLLWDREGKEGGLLLAEDTHAFFLTILSWEWLLFSLQSFPNTCL